MANDNDRDPWRYADPHLKAWADEATAGGPAPGADQPNPDLAAWLSRGTTPDADVDALLHGRPADPDEPAQPVFLVLAAPTRRGFPHAPAESRKPRVIDSVPTEAEAFDLCRDYRNAMGAGWDVWTQGTGAA
jgi:hypothetical protein